MTAIGSDFVAHIIKHPRTCSECSRWMPKGFVALASIKGGKVRKLVCCDDCRLEFDARFWDGVALNNAKRRRL